MELSEQELREMVRAAIARQAAPPPRTGALDAPPLHASHLRLTLVGGGDADGRCLIEPSVPCTHCGYCQSLGH
jgi:hypothetical protein